MKIFNNGKYKSLYAAEQGELAQVRQQVLADQNFRPSYHLAPPTGLLNDPNGLIFDGEKFHIFYQWFPFDAMHGMKHWRHYCTQDFQQFQRAEDLIPCEDFESHGCYSGGALLVGDKIACFYTGNTRCTSDNQRVPYQNLAIFDKRGKLLSKRVLLDQAPAGYTEHVRDPKPYFSAEGKIRFVCGAQRENLTGTALMFEMEDLDSQPVLLGELELNAFDNSHVFMWECPDLFKLAGKDLFIWSPQGKLREAHQFQNNYHSTYALGTLQGLDFQAQQISELDYGFDFYAPQTFAGLEGEKGIMYGWCGLPDLTYPTDKFKWHSMLTLPREIWLENNQLYQRPLKQIYQSMQLQKIQLENSLEVANLERAYLKFEAPQQDFQLDFFHNQAGQFLRLSYQNGVLCLDRQHSEQTELMQQFGVQRYCEIQDLRQVEIFFDHSIVEIFLNQGEKALTSRFFISQRKNLFTTNVSLEIEIGYPPRICNSPLEFA